MFKKILIANRGEIAERIIRCCKEMGIEAVAVYSSADATSLHVQLADEAYCIGPAKSSESYLNMENILSVAALSGCDAIHPGFGYLSENSTFARLVEKCGMTFIGPSGDVIDQMGNKSVARQMMIEAGVPVVPGSDGSIESVSQGKEIARKIGYPVLIKASAGGGGRGMRKCFKEEDFEDAYLTAKAEAKACFGDDDMYMEKLVVGPEVKGMIDLSLPIEQNLRRVASRLGKSLSDLTVMVLAKPRHDEVIKQMHNLGIRVMAIPDGDVAASVLCCLPDAEVDMVYGIGGAPEGVAAAAAIRALGGDMQARLIPRNEVKGDTEENRKIAAEEVQRCEALGVKVNEILKLEDLVRDDNLVFVATGITHGELLKGISRRGNLATTETLLIRGKSRTIRKIQSIHYLDRKDSEIYEILRN